MRHRYKKIRIGRGKDEQEILLRKLTVNFFKHGKLTTTKKRAKTVKSVIDKYVQKALTENEANKNYLLKKIGEKETVDFLFKKIGLQLKDKKSGWTKIIYLQPRLSDGAAMAKIEWSYPVVIETDKSVKTVKDQKSKIKTK